MRGLVIVEVSVFLTSSSAELSIYNKFVYRYWINTVITLRRRL